MERIQRKRTKGWKMPENTVSVSRPGKWGNPVKLVGDMIYIDAGYRRKILGKWVYVCQGDINQVLTLYRIIVTGVINKFSGEFQGNSLRDFYHWIQEFEKNDLSELKGKNLACFCRKEQPCHADILLELANPS